MGVHEHSNKKWSNVFKVVTRLLGAHVGLTKLDWHFGETKKTWKVEERTLAFKYMHLGEPKVKLLSCGNIAICDLGFGALALNVGFLCPPVVWFLCHGPAKLRRIVTSVTRKRVYKSRGHCTKALIAYFCTVLCKIWACLRAMIAGKYAQKHANIANMHKNGPCWTQACTTTTPRLHPRWRAPR